MVKKDIRTYGLPEYRTFHKVPHKGEPQMVGLTNKVTSEAFVSGNPDTPNYIPGREWDGGRELPKVKMHGKWYYVDENLKELRSVTNPHKTIPL